jgi:hypothetical protein
LAPELSSRGIGIDDLDNDGDLDVVVLNSRTGPTLLRNETRDLGSWIEIRLRGTRTNPDGVGAHVRVSAGGLVQLDEVHSGRGYQSHHGMRLHYGLGHLDRIDRIEVRWIGGSTQVFQDLPVNQIFKLTEGGKRMAIP